jgi:hypothetical protein
MWNAPRRVCVLARMMMRARRSSGGRLVSILLVVCARLRHIGGRCAPSMRASSHRTGMLADGPSPPPRRLGRSSRSASRRSEFDRRELFFYTTNEDEEECRRIISAIVSLPHQPCSIAIHTVKSSSSIPLIKCSDVSLVRIMVCRPFGARGLRLRSLLPSIVRPAVLGHPRRAHLHTPRHTRAHTPTVRGRSARRGGSEDMLHAAHCTDAQLARRAEGRHTDRQATITSASTAGSRSPAHGASSVLVDSMRCARSTLLGRRARLHRLAACEVRRRG